MSKSQKNDQPVGKDIRSFFGGKNFGQPKVAPKQQPQKRTSTPIDLSDDDAPKSASKKQKTTASTAKPLIQEKKLPQKSPAKKPSAKKPTPARAAKNDKKPSGKKRGRVINSDSDSEDEFQAEEEEEESEGDIEIDFTGDSDDDDTPVKPNRAGKKAASLPKAAAKAQQPAAAEAKAGNASRIASSKIPATKDVPAPSPAARKMPTSMLSKPKAPAKKAGKEELPDDVKQAIAAVDAAAKKLPQIEIDLMDEANFGMGGGADTAPANPGSKEVPRGHPDCLTGKTFVFTGVLDSLWRNEAEDLIKRHAGRVTGSVSGKTTFLVVGSQAGKSKTSQATAKGTQMIDEDGLLALVKAAPDPNAGKENVPEPMEESDDEVTIVGSGIASSHKQSDALRAEFNRMPSSSKHVNSATKARLAGQGKSDAVKNGQLWVEKYRPKSTQELVGNTTVIANLQQWLRTWEGVHLRGEEASTQKGRGKPKDLGKKAVLLSGPPGIGKTSSAMIVTRELGYLPIEINASDTRNKADSKITGGMGGKLANAVKELCTNTAIGQDEEGRKKRICLIMDEVDGMSGGDRGGVSELITTIKASKVPVICICNEKYNQKLKSLRNSVLELDFRKPSPDQITKRAAVICKAEGLSVNDTTLNTVAAGANGDIRLVLGQLQMIRLRSKTLSYDDAKNKLGTSKDADMSPFEAGRKLLSTETTRMSLSERTELVFQDMDLVPLLIQENYLNHRPVLANNNETVRMSLIAKAADAFSMGDLVNRAVRQHQSWSLMPFAATVGSVLPASYMRGGRETFYGEMNFPRFTAWLGQNSSYGKQRRLLGELHTRMSGSGNSTVDRTGMRLDYLPVFRKTLVQPLIQSEKEGIEEVIEQMQEYCLNKDDHEFILSVTQFKSHRPALADPYKGVPAATKSAFTRQLNQSISHTKAKSTIMIEEFKRGGRLRKKPAEEKDYDEGLGGDPELEAAAKAERAKQSQQSMDSDEEEDEDEWTPKDAAAVAKKEKQLAKRGIVFQSKIGAAKGSGKSSRGRGGGVGSGKGSSKAGSGRGRGRGK